MSETIVVLDFGSQYSQLIARRIRECRVYSKILPFSTSAEEIRRENPRGIILSGGPSSVYAEHAPKCDPAIFELGIPILGICYGLQLMVHTLGGEIERGKAREYGKATLSIIERGELFADLPYEIQVWMSHGDKVVRLPEGDFSGARFQREYRILRRPGRRQGVLRPSVSPRGGPYPPGKDHHRQLLPPHLQVLPATGPWSPSLSSRSGKSGKRSAIPT